MRVRACVFTRALSLPFGFFKLPFVFPRAFPANVFLKKEKEKEKEKRTQVETSPNSQLCEERRLPPSTMPDANNDTSGAATPGLPDQNPLPTRFEVELEFVQSLANIQYVTYLLTQQQIWKSPNFKNYLKYLEYWCNPPYSQCIVYPNCLFILKLLNGFMESAIVNEDGLLEGLDELPKIIQLQGPQWMNEMVERWAN